MTAKVETQKILVKADRSLVLTERIPIVEGNVAVDQVEFTFEEPADWQDLSIFAYFTNSASETTEHVNLGTLGSATKKTASIPASVTQDVGFIGVALQGAIIDESGDEPVVEQRATTQENKTILKVYKSGVVVYNPDPESPIAPSILEEVEQRLAEAIAATEEANQSISQHNDPFVGATDEAAGDKGLVPAPAAGETDLVLTGNADWTDVHDLIPDKADIDGYYELLTAGAADNLTGRGDGVSASYLYRTAGGTEDIADGVATIKAIYGETVGWNQLAAIPFCSQDTGSKGVAFTPNADGSVTLSGMSTGVIYKAIFTPGYTVAARSVTGHTYLVKKMGTAASSVALYNNNNGVYIYTDNVAIQTATGESNFFIRVPENIEINGTVFPQIFDLTQMFGAGNEPATVEEFEALYPEPYYPYDAGTLKPVNMTGVETVGFNQWDEEWEVGNIDTTTGAKVAAAGYIRSKNSIDVFPSTVYSVTKPTTNTLTLFFYDASGDFISYTNAPAANANYEFTTPANCRYVNFSIYHTTYNNDIAIHLKWSGYRDGEYESYWKSQRAIDLATYFPTGLKGIKDDCRDALYEDHADTMVGVVDLGTLNWSKTNNTNPETNFFGATVSSMHTTKATYFKCSKYQYGDVNTGSTTDKAASIANNYQIRIRDTSYETAADFKAAMSGVMFYYPLKTPTTVEIDPPLNMQLKVSDFGTEKIMVPEGEISAPPTMQVVYGLNAVDTIRRLPQQYISDDSFENFCDAAYGSGTVTKTWDDTDNCYHYEIASLDDDTIASLVDVDWRD